MNPLIKKLAQESFFDEATNAPSDKMYTFSEAKMQKFAELIIKESITEMEKHDYHATWLGEKLKQHFGVKE